MLRDVIVVAHQDDWQVFMGDALTKRVRAGRRIVFVYLTAGDDGRDSVYWQTRERAALQSTRVAATLPPESVPNCGIAEIMKHPILRCDLANTRSYFLRLPDGRRNGQGFAVHNYGSLRKLRMRTIPALSAIDGSTTYKGWSDLAGTVSALATIDSGEIVLHATDPSVVKNPHDHFDHRMAGLLTAELRRSRNWNVVYYVGYALATRAANRSARQVQTKTELFLAYDREMVTANPAWSTYLEHPAFYSACMQRTYARSYSPRSMITEKRAETSHSP